MNFAQLVAATEKRAALPGEDVRAALVADDVNFALHELEVAYPFGWDWLRRRFTFATVEDQADYTFDELARDNFTENAPIGADDPLIVPIAAVTYLEYLPSGVAPIPLRKRPWEELRAKRHSTILAGAPIEYAIDAQTVTLFGTPNDAYDLRVECIVSEPDLVEPGDTPILPARYHNVLVQLARALVSERLQEDKSAVTARNNYEKLLARMRAHASAERGAGQIPDWPT